MGRMAEIQRMQLEKIMDASLMGLTTEKLSFKDAKVCRNFLCGTCPHDLFSNTKVDLGPCPKSHHPRLRTEYLEALSRGEVYPEFEAEFQSNILNFISDIDRKIAINKRRIDQTPEELHKFSNLMREIGEIEKIYHVSMEEVERLGEEGKVEESLKELEKSEAIKSEKENKERELQRLNDSAGASGHQKLRVCDVCGAYLSVLDSDRRLADHFGGRMHLGYLRIREMISTFQERRKNPAQASFNPNSNSNSNSNVPLGPSNGNKDQDKDRDDLNLSLNSNPNISTASLDDYRPLQRPRDRERERESARESRGANNPPPATGTGRDRKRSRSPERERERAGRYDSRSARR